MFKKICVLFAVFVLFFSRNIYAEKIVLGYVDFPPYEFEDKGKPSGVLVDIVQTVFQKAGVQLELKFLPFEQAYKQAKNGKINGLFNFYKTEDRLKSFDYSEPTIKNPLIFFVRKDSEMYFNKLEDLKGLKIGVMPGYAYGKDFDESSLFVREEADSHLANIKKLVLGQIDAYVCDKLVGLNVALKNNLMSELKILSSPLKVMDGYIGFTKDKHQEVINKINEALKEMNKNGDIEKMINKYIENMW
ncbi:transporter substrate-binding domain-containing protein [bacterium]|nr:transporter substrate-binding domain-containing protein [bacterium]